MKRTVFVDTVAWLALTNKSDDLHAKAQKVRDSLVKHQVQFVVTDYVIVEIANALSKIPFRSAAIQLITFIQQSENILIFEVDKGIFNGAWDLYSTRPDKEWSMTDCISFTVMKHIGITEAFTNDHHFEQAGFSVLIK